MSRVTERFSADTPRLSRRPLTGSKVDQALFVDREVEIEAILAAIGMQLNVFVSGAPGSGKTSLLRRLETILVKERTPVAYVNAEAGTSAAGLISAVAAAISPGIDSGSSWVTVADDETDLEVIEEAIATRAVERLVLLVDGVSADVMMTLFGRYRDRLWQSPELIWVVATRMAAPPRPADAFFDRVITMAPLSREAVEELLKRRASAMDEEHRRQLAAALGSVQPLEALVHAQTLALSVDPETVLEAVGAYRALVEALPGRLRSLLEALLSVGPTYAGDERLLAWLGTSRPRVVAGLKELVERDLVRSDRDGRRQIYSVRSGLGELHAKHGRPDSRTRAVATPHTKQKSS